MNAEAVVSTQSVRISLSSLLASILDSPVWGTSP